MGEGKENGGDGPWERVLRAAPPPQPEGACVPTDTVLLAMQRQQQEVWTAVQLELNYLRGELKESKCFLRSVLKIEYRRREIAAKRLQATFRGVLCRRGNLQARAVVR